MTDGETHHTCALTLTMTVRAIFLALSFRCHRIVRIMIHHVDAFVGYNERS